MATIMKCDRCGSENKPGEVVIVSIPVIGDYNRMQLEDLRTKNYDFCSRCLKMINDFVKPQPVVKAG